MLHRFPLFCLFLVCIFFAKAQPDFVYDEVFGESASALYNEYAPLMAVDQLGNTYSTSRFHTSVQFDSGPSLSGLLESCIYLKKNGPDGTLLWRIAIQNHQDQRPYDITTDSEGNVLLIGRFRGTLDFDPSPTATYYLSDYSNPSGFVLKLNPEGEFIWAKRFGSDGWVSYGRSIIVDGQDNIYIAGTGGNAFKFGSTQFIIPTRSLFVMRLDSDGDLDWFEHYHEVEAFIDKHMIINGDLYLFTAFDSGINLQLTSTGFDTFPIGETDLLLLRINKSNGNFINAQNWPRGGHQFPRQLRSGGPGVNYFLYQTTNNNVSTSILAKTNFSYQFDWVKIYDTLTIRDFAVNENAELFLAGGKPAAIYYNPPSASYIIEGESQGALLKLTSNGSLMRKSVTNTNGYTMNSFIEMSPNNSVMVSGTFLGNTSFKPDDINLDQNPLETYDAFQFKWQDCPPSLSSEIISGCVPLEYDGEFYYADQQLKIDEISPNGCLSQHKVSIQTDSIDSYIDVKSNYIRVTHEEAEYSWSNAITGEVYNSFTNLFFPNEPGRYLLEVNTDQDCTFKSKAIRFPEEALHKGNYVRLFGQYLYATDDFLLASYENSYKGSLFYYEWVNGELEQPFKIKSEDMGTDTYHYGHAMSFDNDWLAIGSPFEEDKGNVYLYRFVDGALVLEQVISPNPTIASFGFSVSLDNNYLLIGAPNTAHNNVPNNGIAYLYTYEDNEWKYARTIYPPIDAENTRFGAGVQLLGNQLYIAAPGYSNSFGSGIWYQFQYNGSIQLLNQIESDLSVQDYLPKISIQNNQAFLATSKEILAYNIGIGNLLFDQIACSAPEGKEVHDFEVSDNHIVIKYYDTNLDCDEMYIYQNDGNHFHYLDQYNGYIPNDGYANDFTLFDNTLYVGAPKTQKTPLQEGKIYVYPLEDLTVSTNLPNHHLQMEFYPNPTTDVLNIQSTASEVFTFEFFDLGGKKVMGSQQRNLDLSVLPPGIYFLRVKDDAGTIRKSTKIIKQ